MEILLFIILLFVGIFFVKKSILFWKKHGNWMGEALNGIILGIALIVSALIILFQYFKK